MKPNALLVLIAAGVAFTIYMLLQFEKKLKKSTLLNL